MAYQSLRDNLISNVSKPKLALLAVALSGAFSGGAIATAAPVMSVSPHYSADQADKDAAVAVMVKKMLPEWNNGKGAWARIKDTQKIGVLAQALMKPTTTNANGTKNQGGIVDTMVRTSLAIDDIGLVMAEHGQKLAAVKSFDKDANVLVLNDVALSGLTETALAEGGQAAATTGQMFSMSQQVAERLDGNLVQLGRDASATAAGTIAVGRGATAKDTFGIAIGERAQASQFRAVAIGAGANAAGRSSLAIGSDSDANGKKSLALGDMAIANAESSVALGANSRVVLADGKNVISVGDSAAAGIKRKLINLAAADLANEGTAAATTGQVFTVQENVKTVDSKFGEYTNTSELERNYLKADQLDVKVVDSIDKKLSTLSSITNEATGDASIALGRGAKGVGVLATAVGYQAVAGIQSVAIGSYAQAKYPTATAIGESAKAIGPNGVALGFGSVSRDNEVSVGNNVMTRKIVNVRGGDIESGSHQVVTGGQLFDLTTRVDGIEQSSVLISDVDKRIDARIADVGTRVAGLDQQVTQAVLDVKNDVNQNVATAKAEVIEHVAGVKAEVIEHVAGVKADITADMTKRIAKASNGVAIGADRATTYTRDVNANARADAAGSWAAGKGSEATGLNATALNGGVASGNNATAVGLDATASADNTVAMGVNAQATATNSVAVGVNSQTDRANTFAVGNVGGERQMVNVAAGTQDTDGVNVAQLNKGLDGVRGEVEGVRGDVAKVHRSLKGDINKLRKDMSAGIASSMAMAGIPQAYMPGKALLGAGVANYGGYSALAIGGSVISGNGHWITRVQAGASTSGSVSGSVGVGYQW